jgi:uncharacterized protein (DUF1697 family)
LALLRGINVGGHNKLPMRALTDVMVSLGHTNVATYIQSGNVVFDAAPGVTDTVAMADGIGGALATATGVAPAVVVLRREELEEAVAANPFSGETNPKAVHLLFLIEPPGREAEAAVTAAAERTRARGSTDEVHLAGQVIYMRAVEGFGRSVLAEELGRKGRALPPVPAGTARNWATVTALLALMSE